MPAWSSRCTRSGWTPRSQWNRWSSRRDRRARYRTPSYRSLSLPFRNRRGGARLQLSSLPRAVPLRWTPGTSRPLWTGTVIFNQSVINRYSARFPWCPRRAWSTRQPRCSWRERREGTIGIGWSSWICWCSWQTRPIWYSCARRREWPAWSRWSTRSARSSRTQGTAWTRWRQWRKRCPWTARIRRISRTPRSCWRTRRQGTVVY